MAPPWTVRAWPPLLWQADSTMDLRLIHMHTRVVQSGLYDSPCCGQTLWARVSSDATAGVAWDWTDEDARASDAAVRGALAELARSEQRP